MLNSLHEYYQVSQLYYMPIVIYLALMDQPRYGKKLLCYFKLYTIVSYLCKA